MKRTVRRRWRRGAVLLETVLAMLFIAMTGLSLLALAHRGLVLSCQRRATMSRPQLAQTGPRLPGALAAQAYGAHRPSPAL